MTSSKPPPGSSPASRLGSYAVRWIDNARDLTVTNLNAQSELLKSYEGGSIVSDIQEVTRSMYQIWFEGLDTLLTRK
jgi:hypothetical protein